MFRLFGNTQRKTYVRVTFRDLAITDRSDTDPNDGYTYSWPFREPPHVGQWVRVRGGDELSTGIVCEAIRVSPATKTKILPVEGILTPEELAWYASLRSHNELVKADQEAIWLDMARHKLGLPVTRAIPSRPPGKFPVIPPKNGRITGPPAKERGRIWWMIYKRAEESGRPSSEIASYKEIAEFWYARGRKHKQD